MVHWDIYINDCRFYKAITQAPYREVRQRHLGPAELTGALSVFTLPGQVLRYLLPHHPLLAFPQRTGDLEERTHIQVVLQTEEAQAVRAMHAGPSGGGMLGLKDSQESAADSFAPDSH